MDDTALPGWASGCGVDNILDEFDRTADPVRDDELPEITHSQDEVVHRYGDVDVSRVAH